MYKLAFILLFCSVSIFAQDTIYLDKNYKKVSKIESANYYQLVTKSMNNKELVFEETYSLNNEIVIKEIFKNYYSGEPEKIRRITYYDLGTPKSQSVYKNGGKYYEFSMYWRNSNLKRKELYINKELVTGVCWDEKGNEIPFYPFETAPEFPGGTLNLQLFLKTEIGKISIPSKVKGKQIVIVFDIDENGIIKNVEVEKSINPNFDKKIVQIVESMPVWEPGTREKKPAKARKSLPIKF